ncbi:hypothetical protein [uncultured Ruminococcus sp.]|uniref:hypothetical protein n=1 Tax=uncultured Ruminococcus sp. TaxID=165186 RepID=UPI0025F51EB7|nr:hypothetical protein [uncultured Ruminococcus sp.]
MSMTDMDQNSRIMRLERKLNSLECKVNGGESGMSRILQSLIGQDVTLNISYEEINCRVLDCDDEWIKIIIFGKKKNTTLIRRVCEITKVTLDKDGI